MLKKTYQKPTLARRESLSRVTAAMVTSYLIKIPDPET